jgi:hypothetical protein
VFMNNTVLTKRQLGVNPCAHEQLEPNQKPTGVNSGAHEQHGPNQKTTGGEPYMNTWVQPQFSFGKVRVVHEPVCSPQLSFG